MENNQEITKFWAGVILYNSLNNSVLMQKRDGKAPVNPNKWAFFGGGGEVNETPEDCVVRETKEELGIDIEKTKLSLLQDYLYEKENIWRYIFVMDFDLEKSAMKLGEGEDFDWVSMDDILDYVLTDNTRKDMEAFIKKIVK